MFRLTPSTLLNSEVLDAVKANYMYMYFLFFISLLLQLWKMIYAFIKILTELDIILIVPTLLKLRICLNENSEIRLAFGRRWGVVTAFPSQKTYYVNRRSTVKYGICNGGVWALFKQVTSYFSWTSLGKPISILQWAFSKYASVSQSKDRMKNPLEYSLIHWKKMQVR